jgi:MoaA/NifB/PqqE/SkfB family radical SAM enzyme
VVGNASASSFVARTSDGSGVSETPGCVDVTNGNLGRVATELPLVHPSYPIPRFLYLRLSSSDICNFRCKHCHIWMNRSQNEGLSVERRAELLAEFAELRPRGFVEFPGGEVTLAFAELCRLADVADRFGLRAGIVTNGSMIRAPFVAKRLVNSGIERINVSLDSHRPELHDYVRGVPGAFAQAVKALRLLLSARQDRLRLRRRPGPFIQVVTVVFDRNVHELPGLVELCRSLGVDQVNLQLLNRTFANQHAARDLFFERHFWHDADAKHRGISALRGLVARYASDSMLRTTVADLGRLERAIEANELDPIESCAAHRRNVIIDVRGDVSFCFDLPEGAPTRSVGSVKERPLGDVLAAAHARQMRDLMTACRKPCGLLECHRAD